MLTVKRTLGLVVDIKEPVCNENEAFVTGGDKRGQFSVQEELRENCFETLKFAVLKARYCCPCILQL
jgi:hypothetical protein